jgi:hypothetical protein
MLFLGQPSAVNRALARLKYQTTYAFITDTVRVVVLDGERSDAGDDGGDDSFGRGVGSCLDAGDFSSASRRGPGPFVKACFAASANVTVRVGRYAGSSDVVTPPDPLTDNTQLGVAAAVLGLLLVCCLARAATAKLCGWELRGVPADFESDDDSGKEAADGESSSSDDHGNSSDDEDIRGGDDSGDDDDSGGGGDAEGGKLTRRGRAASDRKRRLWASGRVGSPSSLFGASATLEAFRSGAAATGRRASSALGLAKPVEQDDELGTELTARVRSSLNSLCR